jgi:uncharacterized DUF497 family protein
VPNRLFEWDDEKDLANQDKHNVTFAEATFAFDDPSRLIIVDKRHSKRDEKRYFCIGRVRKGILTVRFTYRNGKIRIFGAGFWREGKIQYEAQTK